MYGMRLTLRVGDDLDGELAAEDPVAVDVVADIGLVGHSIRSEQIAVEPLDGRADIVGRVGWIGEARPVSAAGHADRREGGSGLP